MADVIDVAEGLARSLRAAAAPDPTLLEQAARAVLSCGPGAMPEEVRVLATLLRGAIRRLRADDAAGVDIEPVLSAIVRGAPADVLLGRRAHEAWKPIAAMLDAAAMRRARDPGASLAARALAAFASAMRGGPGFDRFVAEHAHALPPDGAPLLAGPAAMGAWRERGASMRTRLRWNSDTPELERRR